MSKQTDNKKQLKNLLIALLIVIGITVGFIFWAVNQVEMPSSNYSQINSYAKYLKKTTGEETKINVYIDPVNGYKEYNYYLSIQNRTDYFYSGTVKLVDEDGRTIYSNRFINIRPSEVRMVGISLDASAVDYQLSNNKFYQFTYPLCDAKALVSRDNNNSLSYTWLNLIFADEELTIENCLSYAKYIYVEDVLAGMDSCDIYFYATSQVTFDENNGVNYPQINTSRYGAILDQSTHEVKIVDLTSAEMTVLALEKME